MSILGSRFVLFVCSIVVCFAVSGGPAAAQTKKSFSIPIHATSVAGTAVAGTTGIELPNNGLGTFFINFVLPLDYQNNGEVTVVFYLTPQVNACVIRFVPASAARYRPNAPFFSGLNGISGGNPNVNIGTSNVVAKAFSLTAPGGPLVAQRKGDAITLMVMRQADDAADTCADEIFVVGIDVRYPVMTTP